MKILQLTNRLPYPLKDGGSLCMYADLEGFYKAGEEISLLAMNTTKHWYDVGNLPSLFHKLHHLEVVTVKNNINIFQLLKSILKGTSYNIDRFVNKNYESQLIKLLQQNQYDIIQLESLYLAPYTSIIKKYSNAKIVLRQHNVEYLIWERMASKTKNILKKILLHHFATKLKQFEINSFNHYDLILAISKEDKAHLEMLRCSTPIIIHPYGIDLKKVPFVIEQNLNNPITLYHLGAMDWRPNQEGVNWLLEHVMPLITTELPNTQFYLAGRNMPNTYFEQKNSNVIVVGEVNDASSFEKDKQILIVPLLSGSGIRIKILQAMAKGKIVISTSQGVEGLEIENGKHVFIADEPQQFAHTIINTVKNFGKMNEVLINSRKLIEEKYSQKQLIKELLEYYKSLISS